MKTTRVQLELPDKSLQRLKNLKEVTEAGSYAEVIRKSLQLYESLIAETQAGNEVSIRQNDGEKTSYKLIF